MKKSLKNNVIQVFEHSSIAFKGKHSDPKFTEHLHSAFERYFSSNEDTQFFSMIPYGVRFNQYVGVIHIGTITVEVLPKASKENNKNIWQGVLLNMLKTCNLITAKSTGSAPLRLKSNSIMDLYFEWFLKELDYLIRRGLIKRYRKTEGQINALKGAIVFPKHVSKNIIHQERFYSRFTTYDQDHLIHQILFECLQLIEHISNSPVLFDQIGRQKLSFPQVESLRVNAEHFDQIRMDRKNQPYKNALDIAKLLLLNYRPDIRNGRDDLLAIMFDMNLLWEEYIYQILRRYPDSGWTVQAQARDYFWERKTIRPDIVLKSLSDKEKIVVIDTKWKTVEDGHPNDGDLKQMFVYNHHWKSFQSILLYPRTKNQVDVKGTYELPIDGMKHSCKLGFVDVLSNNLLNQNLAEEILAKINLEKIYK